MTTSKKIAVLFFILAVAAGIFLAFTGEKQYDLPEGTTFRNGLMVVPEGWNVEVERGMVTISRPATTSGTGHPTESFHFSTWSLGVRKLVLRGLLSEGGEQVNTHIRVWHFPAK